MTTEKKVIIGIAIVAVIGIGIWWYKKKKATTATGAAVPGASTASSVAPVTDPVLASAAVVSGPSTNNALRNQILALVAPAYQSGVATSLAAMNDQELADMLTLITVENKGTNVNTFIAAANAADAARYKALQTKYGVFT